MTSPYLRQVPRGEVEVRRAKFKAALEKNRAVGRAEGLSDAIIDECNRDMIRAVEMGDVWRDIFEQIAGIKMGIEELK